mgnify:CR=1 FL=1
MERPLTFHIITYGCQMNEADSEMIAGILKKNDYEKIDDFKQADIVLVNTCAVREKPEVKAFGRLTTLKYMKEKNPEMILCLCGCLAQKEKENVVKKYPFVDIVVGPQSIAELPALIEKAIEFNIKKRERLAKMKMVAKKAAAKFKSPKLTGNFENSGDDLPETDILRESPFKAFVTIMRGCNNFCSYCIVPYTRGREKSRPFDVIIEEVKTLINSGYKEITLLGQNVNSYNDGTGRSFPELLRAIDMLPGKFYVRFMTSHPKDLSDKLIEVMTDSVHIAPQVHLPVQAGATKILELMNRRYSREHYLGLIDKIRANIKNVTITTDVMVGFPQETEEDFNETMSLFEKVRFNAAYMFYYSEREGTKAVGLPGAVPVKERLARLDTLIKRQMDITLEVNRAMIGQIHEGLVEGRAPKTPNEYSVRTFNNLVVVAKVPPELAAKELVGSFVKLKITEGFNFVLKGDIIEA